jgi:hypothetical protein
MQPQNSQIQIQNEFIFATSNLHSALDALAKVDIFHLFKTAMISWIDRLSRVHFFGLSQTGRADRNATLSEEKRNLAYRSSAGFAFLPELPAYLAESPSAIILSHTSTQSGFWSFEMVQSRNIVWFFVPLCGIK